MEYNVGTTTYSAQTFTPGTAPVAGYESQNFARLVTTGQTGSCYSVFGQKIEDVRTLVGQTITISFWAKAGSGTPKIGAGLTQIFGSGGSSLNLIIPFSTTTITTSWARYSLTYTVPSISGKTVGTTTPGALFLQMWVSAGTDSNARTGSLGIQSNTFDLWGVQLEYGSKATPFQTASGGSPEGELAMCQRYYYAHAVGNTQPIAIATSYSTTLSIAYLQFPVTMRTAPSIVVATGTNFYGMDIAGAGPVTNTLTIGTASTTGARVDGT
jgi:hypothetical protein